MRFFLSEKAPWLREAVATTANLFRTVGRGERNDGMLAKGSDYKRGLWPVTLMTDPGDHSQRNVAWSARPDLNPSQRPPDLRMLLASDTNELQFFYGQIHTRAAQRINGEGFRQGHQT
jgi:hypothetical protein